ncbi:MAG TPA: DegT/DnrJ/EryC1/StrS family aminotransferase [Gaiellaceae bacterium]|nr:DegT/DnrJ/EryC1/StrS family aminotransferase [Gaiellaceae bacterium]
MSTVSKDSRSEVSVPFVDLGPVSSAVKASLLAEIEELIDSGLFINGPYVAEFERAFAEASDRRHAVGVASGLDALRLGLVACGLTPGDEVIVPAMTFVATFEAVVQAGGRVVVVDVDEDDAGMDVEAAAAAVSGRTSFLLPVHLYGQMADGRRLVGLAERHGLAILEDACQAHGAERDGLRAGGLGVAAAFSFYPSKNLGAMGDAGALVCDDEDVVATMKALREHGQTRRYHAELVGYTARLDAIQALVLSHKLPLLAGWNAERRAAAEFYGEMLDGVGDLRLPAVAPGSTHVWHVYALRTADPISLADFLSGRGVATNRHYPEPPHLSAAFASLGLERGAFPVAEAIARETLSLPIYPGITKRQLDAVVSGVRDFFAQR